MGAFSQYPMARRGRYELVATQPNGNSSVGRTLRFETLDMALLEAERYRANPGQPQYWTVVVRDKTYATGDLEVANQTVVVEATA